MHSSITVIGGSGFIGTRFTQHLLQHQGTEVVIIDKAPSAQFAERVRLADIRDLDALVAAMPDASPIVHLAAEHRDDVTPKSLYDDVNVQGTRNVCEAARRRRVRTIVFTSSVAVYGFAPLGTDEGGAIQPFNDYGRTKHEAEEVLRAWQAEAPSERSLFIVRPTVVFGERNRGNVYNLLKQIAGGRFVMIGSGQNRKSMAYVENVSAFLAFALQRGPGVHLCNYIDKPDLSMNQLVGRVRQMLGRPALRWRLPVPVGMALGHLADGVATVTGKKFPVSAIRVKKFCANTLFSSGAAALGFEAPVSLEAALERTVRHEFIEQHRDETVFYTE
ncbi:NAD-dependent epimerase/dehydratase family protein [Ideonella sp. 4Y11]|uniref:NAD-dependent epimerase/dehydratase family protein n=1 Tax=Ideonella aquatica TaxID=2824119 RepID=A0A941BF35_9BURK|nr:NAD-dependent epimerase/dehydratase family protein [Ideonella aquatica]MBQ0958346.1 NAD-dependent epimerase/dehydratase family protein [Ideonella aquatica]